MMIIQIGSPRSGVLRDFPTLYRSTADHVIWLCPLSTAFRLILQRLKQLLTETVPRYTLKTAYPHGTYIPSSMSEGCSCRTPPS